MVRFSTDVFCEVRFRIGRKERFIFLKRRGVFFFLSLSEVYFVVIVIFVVVVVLEDILGSSNFLVILILTPDSFVFWIAIIHMTSHNYQ